MLMGNFSIEHVLYASKWGATFHETRILTLEELPSGGDTQTKLGMPSGHLSKDLRNRSDRIKMYFECSGNAPEATLVESRVNNKR